jgi:hypothetical protein
MRPLDRAEAVLSRARALNAAVICPGDARSPMDADVTVTVARQLITDCEADVHRPAQAP